MYTQIFSCLSIEILLKTNNKDVIDYINFIMYDLIVFNHVNLKGVVIVEKEGEYYKGFIENKIVFKSSNIHEMALLASSEIINMFVRLSQNILFLHAGGIEKNGKVTLFVGQSKSGKTSIITSILQKYDYAFISDEIIAISLIEKNIIPVKRCLSIRNDMIKELNINKSLGKEFKTIDNEVVTYISYKNIFSSNEVNRNNKIDKIIFPEFSESFKLSKCSKKNAFNILLKCSVNMRSVLPQAFDYISTLLSEISCYSLRFNDLGKCVRSIIEL